MMKTELTLRPVAHSGSGSDMRQWKHVFKYEVEGLPRGEEAWVGEFNHKWQILRRKNGVQEAWTGEYDTPESALTAVQGSRTARLGDRSFEIRPLDPSLIRRRQRGEQVFDVIEYPFDVSNGRERRVAWVGITGMYHDPAPALGSRRLSKDELIQAAGAWLFTRLEKGHCDPFSYPNNDTSLDMPSPVMDYWLEHQEIPGWV